MKSDTRELAVRIVETVFEQLDRDCEWIIGKDHTVTLVARAIRNAEAGTADSAKPASFACDPIDPHYAQVRNDHPAKPATETTAEPPQKEANRIEDIEWSVSRWQAEVENRPLVNIHRRSLDDTWRQVIRHFGGKPELLIGPSHDELVAAFISATAGTQESGDE